MIVAHRNMLNRSAFVDNAAYQTQVRPSMAGRPMAPAHEPAAPVNPRVPARNHVTVGVRG